MKFKLFVLFLGLLLFSSCSGMGLGGSKTDYPSQDNTGIGLEINFNTNDNWISQKRIEYDLTITNSGKKEIILTKDTFKLYTIQKEGGNNVFTTQSLEEFYKNVFGGSEKLVLYQNQKLGPITGSLYIDDNFFRQTTNQKFDYELLANYDYVTEFANNVEIDKSLTNTLKVTDSLSQAAPVKISSIQAVPQSNDVAFIDFYVKDSGPLSFSSKRDVKIDSWEFYFGANSLTDCKVYTDKGGYKQEVPISNIRLNDNFDNVVFSCRTSFSNLGNVANTKVGGKLYYKYSIKLTDSINLPKERGDSSIYNR